MKLTSTNRSNVLSHYNFLITHYLCFRKTYYKYFIRKETFENSLVGIVVGSHPFPFLNTEVKSATLMILGWRRPGKVSTARV